MIPNDSQPKPADPFFFIGDERNELLAGRKVAIAINVNFLLKDGARERGHSIPIHEIPLLRAIYPEGTVQAIPKWVPAIDRRRQLSQGEFQNEFNRLAQTYVVPLGTSKKDHFADVYGATPNEQRINLHKKMFEVARAWTELEKRGIERLKVKYPGRVFSMLELFGAVGDVLTNEEMEALVSIIQPEQIKLESIPLEEVTMESLDQQDAAAAGMPPPVLPETPPAPESVLVAAFTAKGFDETTAMELTTLAIELPDGVPDDILSSIDALKKADGSLHKAKSQLARKVIEDWRASLAPQPA